MRCEHSRMSSITWEPKSSEWFTEVPWKPLEEFYGEYHQLYRKVIPSRKQVSLLREFPLKEIPPTLVRGYRGFNRIRKAYLDYDDDKGVRAGHLNP